MNLRKKITAAAGLLLAAPFIAACTADDAADDETIVIGTICSCSGTASSIMAKATDGISAWVEKTNAAGGLNGHPIKLIIKDDGGEPAKALQAAKELVEQDKVMAIVGETSLVDQSFQAYVEARKVPVVGGLAAEKTFLVSPYFFASGSSTVITIFGMIAEAANAGATHLGTLYCAETPVCAEIDAIGPAFAKAVGIDWTSAKISATQPNYTAQCLSMKDGDVDALFIGHVAPVAVRVAADCTKTDYDPMQVNQLNPLSSDMLASPEFDRALLTANNAVFTDEELPGIAEYREAMEAYASGSTSSDQFTFPVLQSWAGAKLFEAAAEAVDLAPGSSSADVMEGLYSLKDETLDGIAPPLNFTEGEPGFPSCYFPASIDGEKLVSTSQEPTCLTPEQLGTISELLQQAG
jgi:branched-chain amino acid transport system substrate-binding protein